MINEKPSPHPLPHRERSGMLGKLLFKIKLLLYKA
jgi:hypothetical protein